MHGLSSNGYSWRWTLHKNHSYSTITHLAATRCTASADINTVYLICVNSQACAFDTTRDCKAIDASVGGQCQSYVCKHKLFKIGVSGVGQSASGFGVHHGNSRTVTMGMSSLN
jgi:hypothetical protein